MAKKIRFPLKMEHEIEVRTLSELKEHFSLTHILDYVSNGKLITWLRDRYENEIADAIEKLDIKHDEFPKQICEIFNINNVALCQDDLYDLLDEQHNTIYLYGDKFEIPLEKSNITYIGFNNPLVIINSKEKVNLEEKNINLLNVQIDDKDKRLLGYYTNFLTEKLFIYNIVTITINELRGVQNMYLKLQEDVKEAIQKYNIDHKIDCYTLFVGKENNIQDIQNILHNPEALKVLQNNEIFKMLQDNEVIRVLRNQNAITLLKSPAASKALQNTNVQKLLQNPSILKTLRDPRCVEFLLNNCK